MSVVQVKHYNLLYKHLQFLHSFCVAESSFFMLFAYIKVLLYKCFTFRFFLYIILHNSQLSIYVSITKHASFPYMSPSQNMLAFQVYLYIPAFSFPSLPLYPSFHFFPNTHYTLFSITTCLLDFTSLA